MRYRVKTKHRGDEVIIDAFKYESLLKLKAEKTSYVVIGIDGDIKVLSPETFKKSFEAVK